MQSLAALLKWASDHMVVEWLKVKKQRGGSDCGLFAIAVAITLCNGDDPMMQDYDQGVMREHLALCFDCGEIAAFPALQSGRKKKAAKSKREREHLYCHCRMPYIEGSFMVQCQGVKDGSTQCVMMCHKISLQKQCFAAENASNVYK